MMLDAAGIVQLAAAMGLPLPARTVDAHAAAIAAMAQPLAEAERLLLQPPAGGDARAAALAGRAPAAAVAVRPPAAGEDPLGAVVRWCDAAPTGEGPLTGMRIAVKDAVAVAGVPLGCGFPPLARYAAERDSAVVARLRAAGARIVATTRMDCFGMAAGGETSGDGPTRNPHDPRRTAGGSSSGAAASLSLPGVDLAIGCDQGGSIRVPASWCGLLGLKPTHGLVSCAGTVGIDPAIDHTGPLARSAGELAAALDAIAGPQPRGAAGSVGAARAPRRFARAVAEAPARLDGLRVGTLAEGFGAAVGVEPETAAAARGTACRLAGLGATVREVSVPEHLRSGGASLAVNFAGVTALFAGAGGLDFGDGPSPRFARALRDALAGHAAQLSPQMQLAWLLGTAQARRHRGALRAAALRWATQLRAAYDRALGDADVLLTPTTPFPAYRLGQGGGDAGLVARGWSMLGNTEPSNLTGHPAVSLPTATAGGLPVGTMLVGRRGEDARLLAIAATWERAHGWEGAPPRLDTTTLETPS